MFVQVTYPIRVLNCRIEWREEKRLQKLEEKRILKDKVKEEEKEKEKRLNKLREKVQATYTRCNKLCICYYRSK